MYLLIDFAVDIFFASDVGIFKYVSAEQKVQSPAKQNKAGTEWVSIFIFSCLLDFFDLVSQKILDRQNPENLTDCENSKLKG